MRAVKNLVALWFCMAMMLASMPVIAAEPVLEVVSFGVADGDAQVEAARLSPQDFAFDRRSSPAASTRSFDGPVTVAQNDTWQTILARFHVPPDAWTEVLTRTEQRDWPLRPVRDSKVWIESSTTLTPLAVYYALSPRQMVRARMVQGALRIDEAIHAGDSSPVSDNAGGKLYRTADQLGMPEAVVDQMVNLFSGEVDFHRDLLHGFKGTVLFEMFFEAGQPARPGRILAARLITATRTHSAYLFDDGSGTARQYYSAQGYPARRSFLQSPILFSRVTSGYSVARFHPILQLWRAHTGIDFGAPTGTPVRATADGVVSFAGTRGEYGNLVTVRHDDGWSTYYGHLQGFGTGVRTGAVLHQGDLIGRVGMSGMATGPHLHYELRKGAQPFDPTLFKDSAPRLGATQLERFDHLVQWYEKQLSASYRSHFVVP